VSLVYLSHGPRRYDRRPIAVAPRHAWEFQAVVKGRIQPLINGVRTEPAARRLWVFPPGSTHGWSSPDRSPARVAVAHFDQAPPALVEAIGALPLASVPLTQRQAITLEREVTLLADDYRRPTRASELRFDRLRLDLSLLVLGRADIDRPLHDENTRVVSRALGWYAARMADRPTVDDVAEAVGRSSSQLRRVFAATGSPPPLAVMRRLQAERAQSLLRHTDLSLPDIAEACGYGGPSAFSRGFRAVAGKPPSSLRLQP